MGEASDEAHRRAGMTLDQCQRVREEVEKLPESVRGRNINRLLIILKCALSGPPDDGLGGETYFGVVRADEDAFFKAQNQMEQSVEAAVEMVRAARKLYPLMPREEGEPSFEVALKQYPWLRDLDHFEGVIAERFSGEDAGGWEAGWRAAAAIRRAVAAIGTLNVPARPVGRKVYVGAASVVVRAVCYYRHQQKMDPQYWWGEKAEGAGAGRLREQPIPVTDIALLIVAVADGLGLAERNKTLSYLLRKYGKELNNANRKPVRSDFDTRRALLSGISQ